MIISIRALFLVLLATIFLSNPVLAITQETALLKIKKYVKNGAVVLNDTTGNRLISFNEEKVMLPASIIKIITSMFALDILGEAFRFKTEFYLDTQNNLTIKGFGDPFLISEEIKLITKNLKEKGLTHINQIYLDPTAFSAPIIIPGTSQSLNPYDALNGALAVNFNTINIGKTKKGKIYSAEAATPLTALAVEKATQIRRGKKDRISLADNPAESLRYTGEIFTAFLNKEGISIKSPRIIVQASSTKDKLFYKHYSSHPLRSILSGLLKYSNNYIANQIFLIIGARQKGFPATLDKSRAVFNQYITDKLPPQNGEFKLVEASGLSRNNRITATYMMRILELFKDDYRLIYKKYGAYLKSGTLTGVYNYAGYIETKNGLRSFVILLNQRQNGRLKLVRLLQKLN